MYSKGDKVRIVSALDTSWIGKEGIITSVSNFTNNPICYKLDIGGGDWTHPMVEKVQEMTLLDRQEILGLALSEAFRKRDEIRQQINELKFKEEEYQIMIDNIRDWQDQLK